MAILILSFSWLIFTYACVIKSAKEGSITTPWLTIAFKVNALDTSVQDILAKYNQLIENNTQLINQLNDVKAVNFQSSDSKQNYNTTTSSLPVIINNLKQQSALLIEQKEKLQGISGELQNVKQELKIPNLKK
jgi:DNA repair ATPase RecN